MKLSERIIAIVNSIVMAETEATEYRLECDRVEQTKAENSAKEYKQELSGLLRQIDELEIKKAISN